MEVARMSTSRMNDGEFWELVVHTPYDEVPALPDRTVGQVIMKLAALAGMPNDDGVEIAVRFNRNLQPQIVTPIGTYTLILDSAGENLEVEQIV
jgi:hypothetical protein